MNQEFDYVVVGGGSAGCVLAARLSENPKHRVCLIEAGGGGNNILIRIPLALSTLVPDTGLKFNNYCYETVPQPRGLTVAKATNLEAKVLAAPAP